MVDNNIQLKKVMLHYGGIKLILLLKFDHE